MKDFLAARLPQSLLEKIYLKTLKLENSSFIDQELQETRSDLLYSVKLKADTTPLYILVEAQTTYDPYTSIRLREYNDKIARQYIEQTKGTASPYILNMVLYSNTSPWRGARSLIGSFNDKELAKWLYGYEYVIDLCREPKETILKDGAAAAVEIALRLGAEGDFCKKIEDWGLVELVNGLPGGETIILYALSRDQHNIKEILKKFANLDPEKIKTVMSGLQQFEQRAINFGIVQGKAEGKLEGMRQATRDLIQGMFDAGASLLFIAQSSKLSEAEIKEILGLAGKKKKKS